MTTPRVGKQYKNATVGLMTLVLFACSGGGSDNGSDSDESSPVDMGLASYQIQPDEITLSGGQRVELDIYEIDSGTRLTSSTQDDNYLVRWTTSGQFGLLDGVSTTAETDESCVTCGMEYEATDYSIEQGVDTVSASIYQIISGSTGVEYELIEEVSASVKVENEENIRVIHVPIIYWEEAIPPGISLNIGFAVAPVDGAESYSFTVLEYPIDTIPATLGYQDSWAVDENNQKLPSPACCRWTLEPNIGNGWRIPLDGAGYSNTTNIEHIVDAARERFQAVEGLVEVKITIDPERL